MGGRSSASDSTSATATRLKREDFRRTKHDSAFSQWKILISASDWEDHSRGKEGAERYKTQNLPNGTSCPGVYELGIATSRRETRKLSSNSVIPVYLGQSDNLRNRMQQYGRDGDHLENGCTSSKIFNFQTASYSKGPRLFTDIFSRGLSIVYRCAPVSNSPFNLSTASSIINASFSQMNSKKDAEITEKELLDKFDYAWNKGSNGARRQDDIHKKLEHLEKASKFSLLVKKFLLTNQREVGIKIKTGSNSNGTGNNTIFSKIPGIRRLQARPVENSSSDYGNNICGVAIGHGSVCTAPPVSGRKRCGIHKGLRINGYISKLNTEGKVPRGQTDEIQRFSDFRDEKQRYVTESHCGFILDDGCPCRSRPVRGNKRCLEHKGRRIIRRSNLEWE